MMHHATAATRTCLLTSAGHLGQASRRQYHLQSIHIAPRHLTTLCPLSTALMCVIMCIFFLSSNKLLLNYD